MQRQLDGLTDESRACRAGRSVAAAPAEPGDPPAHSGAASGVRAARAGTGTLRRARTTRAQTHTHRRGAHSAASIRSNLLRKQLRLPHTARTARSTHLASYSFAAAALLRRAHTSSPEGTASSQGSGSFSPPTPSLHVSTGTQPKTRSAFATCHGAGN
jgi:hypothetical protein